MTGHNKLNFVFPWTKMAMNWQKLKIAEFSWIKEFLYSSLTHWSRMTHICISTLTIIGSDNGLSPRRRQAIIWTNAGILLIGPLGPNIRENLIEILTFSFTKMYLKMLSTKWRPFCLSLNVLTSLDSWTKHSSPKWPLKCNHIKLRNSMFIGVINLVVRSLSWDMQLIEHGAYIIIVIIVIIGSGNGLLLA